MVRIRRFEDRVRREFGQRRHARFRAHLRRCRGGGGRRVRPPAADDLITSTHRGHGHCLAKGVDDRTDGGRAVRARDRPVPGPRRVDAHRRLRTRHARRRTPSSAAASRLAVGAALAGDVLADGRVAVSFFGDGAGNEGIFHESLNLAAIWRLPVVFVCENNGWAESTPVVVRDGRRRRSPRVRPPTPCRASASTAPTSRRCTTAAGDAVARARAGDGPTLIEAVIPRHTAVTSSAIPSATAVATTGARRVTTIRSAGWPALPATEASTPTRSSPPSRRRPPPSSTPRTPRHAMRRWPTRRGGRTRCLRRLTPRRWS